MDSKDNTIAYPLSHTRASIARTMSNDRNIPKSRRKEIMLCLGSFQPCHDEQLLNKLYLRWVDGD